MASPEINVEEITFAEADFRPLTESASKNPEYNEARLATRRKLGDLAKDAVKRLGKAGLELEQRTSLHNPHQFNGKRVRRLWAYLVRPKKEKARLKKTIGADLAKDLDQAYKNAYLCLAIEADSLEVSMRIHVDAWYDGQNMKRRFEGGGAADLLSLLNGLPGFRLRLDNWKGEWICGRLTRESLAEFFKFYTPGEHSLAVEFRWPAPEGNREAALAHGVPGDLLRALESLEPLYRWSAWSTESEFLFGA
jgi:hypothetical protein